MKASTNWPRGRSPRREMLTMNHTRLTYRFQGRDFRLTGMHAKLVEKLMA